MKQILFVGARLDTGWGKILGGVLGREVVIVRITEDEIDALQKPERYILIIVDADAVKNVPLVVKTLHNRALESRIVVASADPTWKLARDVIKAGASNIFSKLINEHDIRAELQDER